MDRAQANKILREEGINRTYYKRKRYGRGKDATLEDEATWVARIVAQTPKLLRKTHGRLPLMAAVFGVSERFYADICRNNSDVLYNDLHNCLARALPEELPEMEYIKEIVGNNYKPPPKIQTGPPADTAVPDKPKKPGKDDPVTRRNWPADQKKKDQIAVELIGKALLDYAADLEDITEALNLPMHEVQGYIRETPQLQLLEEIGLEVQAGYSRSTMFKRCREGNIQAAKEVLAALDKTGLWASKQQHVHSFQYGPPVTAGEDDSDTVLPDKVVAKIGKDRD